MKKFVNVILSVILSLSLLAFTACDGSDNANVFEADYKEASVAELASIATDVDASSASDEIDFNSGVKIVLDVDVMGTKAQMEMKTKKADDELLMQGSVLTKTSYGNSNLEITGDIYYKAGKLYSNSTTKTSIADTVVSETTNKSKMTTTLEEYLDGFTDISMIELDFEEAIENFEDTENVKFFLAKSKSKTNVKMEITNYTEDETTLNGSIVFAFDKNYKLIGYLIDVTINAPNFLGASETYKTYMSVEPYSGDVTIPTDLDTYA